MKKNLLLAVIAFAAIIAYLFFAFVWIPHAIELSKRSACQSNLHQFDLALQANCVRGGTNYLDRLSDVPDEDIAPMLFRCPSDPNGHIAASVKEADATMSYIYVGGLPTNCPGDIPLIICPPKNHGNKGGNVLFANHECKWIPCPEIDRLIEQTCAYAKSNNLQIVTRETAAGK